MAINYKSYEFQLYNCISQAEKLIHRNDADEELRQWEHRLKTLRDNLESRKFRVAVVGEFNRGKTSFVNALLGKEILPSDYMPTTASINRITYNDTPNAYIVMKSGEKRPVQIADLADYVTKLSTDAAEIAAQVDEAVVEYPSLFCRNGVDLIDTPGMNDEASMNQVTVSRLESIDLAIVAVDASMPFSMTECAFTVQLLESPQVCQIIIVITKIDQIREREREKLVNFTVDRVREDIGEYLSKNNASGDIVEKYHAIFDKPYVFPVSSLNALDGLSRNDMELFKESGFLRLNDELPQIILTSQNNNVVLNASRVLGKTLAQYRDWLNRKQDKQREQASSLAALKSEIARACSDFLETSFSVLIENIIPLQDIEGEKSNIQREFINALSNVKALEMSELQRALSPVVKEQFRVINGQFHTAEHTALGIFQEKVLAPGNSDLRQQLESILSPFPLLRTAMKDKLASLTVSLRPEDTVANEKFYWISSPIPDASVLGDSWNVMPYVNQVIDASLRNYRYRRGKELEEMFSGIRRKIGEQLSEFTAALENEISEYQKELSSGRGVKGELDQIQSLEAANADIRDRFLSELRLA